MSRNSNKAPRRHTGAIVVMILLMLCFIAGTAFVIKLCLDIPHQEVTIRPDTSDIQLPTAPEAPTEAETEPPTETTEPDPVPEHVVTTATIVSTGDILMHKPVIDTGWINGEYNFESIYRYITEDVTAATCEPFYKPRTIAPGGEISFKAEIKIF